MLITFALYAVATIFILGCVFDLIVEIVDGIQKWFKDTKEIIENMKSNKESDNK